MKTCTECGVEKSLSEFHRDRTKTSGYKAKCRGCRHVLRVGEGRPRHRAPVSIVATRTPEQEKASAARVYALKVLVERHEREFRQLVAAEMDRLAVPKHWVKVS